MMTKKNIASVLTVRPRPGFVETPFVSDLAQRALSYLAAGFPVHFCGPSGSGKTTLAMHVAHYLERPIMLICGDDEFGSSDLTGGQNGFHRHKVVDNFVHSVLKTEEDMQQRWVDNRLTVACREGFTLVYDEFTRSRPEANNILLSVLEERVLVLGSSRQDGGYVKVHPRFNAIFTSNPEDYAGVHKTQDALRDRMVTVDVHFFDRATEVAITQARSGLTPDDASRVVDLVRAFRETGQFDYSPTVRSCIMIARVTHQREASVCAGDPVFEQTCLDMLASEPTRGRGGMGTGDERQQIVLALIEEHCPALSSTEAVG